MRSKIAKKIFSVMLSVCLILQMSIAPVLAEVGTEGIPPTYTSLKIPDGVSNEITVPLETTEAEVIALLPKTLNATLKPTATTTGSAVTINSSWKCTTNFSSDTEGAVFEFKGYPTGTYGIDGASFPIIKVTIQGAPVKPEDVVLVEGATYGGDITTKGLSLVGGSLPDKKTQYKAGSGYVLFTPWSQTGTGKPSIEINNATITVENNHAISLPAGEIDLKISGTNEFKVDYDYGNDMNGIYGKDTKLTVAGDGTLTIEGLNKSSQNGFGIKLVGNSKFTRMGNDTFKLNLISYTENEKRKEQEVFGTVDLNGDIAADAEMILHSSAQLTLGRSYSDVKNISKKIDICENAKLIIDDGVTLNLEKDSNGTLPIIYNNYGGSILIRGTLSLPDNSNLEYINSPNITIEDEGRILLGGKVVDLATGKFKFDEYAGLFLSSDNGGEYICVTGTIKWEPQSDNDGNLTGGTLTMNNASINMQDYDSTAIICMDIGVPITLNIIGNNTIENLYGYGITISDLTLTGSGNLSVKSEISIVYKNKFDMTNFSGKLNAIVECIPSNVRLRYATAYGNVSYIGEKYYDEFTVSEGSQLTIESGKTLYAKVFTKKGEVINNGTLRLERKVDDAGLKDWVYGDLNLKGTGIVIVIQTGGGSIRATFTNDGKLINETDTPLDFSSATEDQGELAKDGYHWDNATKTLTLENLILSGLSDSRDKMAISLPEGENVTLELKGYNKITGFKSAVYQGAATLGNEDALPEAKGSLTITGDGMLTYEDLKQVKMLMSDYDDGPNAEDVLTTTGKLIMQSGSIVMGTSEERTIKAVGMEIKGGSIGNESVNAPICSLGDFTMSGGKVIAGDGYDEGSIGVRGDMTITGGDLITGKSYNGIAIKDGNFNMAGGNLTAGDSSNGIMIQNGCFTMTGGNLTIHNDVDKESIGIGLASLLQQADQVEKFSVSGGVLDIKVGMAALIFMNYSGASVEPTFETNGMTVTTNPIGGTLKSTIILVPTKVATKEIKLYSLTADEKLDAEMAETAPNIKNACKTLNIVKAATNPSNGGSTNGGKATTDPTPASNAPTKATTVVDGTVTDKTANVTVSKDTVSEVIKKAQEEAKKNSNEKNGIEVELKVDTKNSAVENISANLSKESVEELVSEGVKELSINSGTAKIDLDLETLKTIKKQVGSDIEVSAKKVDNATLSAEAKAVVGNRPVYDFSITGANGEKVTQFGKGKISLSLPYTLGADEKPENLTVYYIDDKGNLKEMTNVVYDEKTKTITFETDHFSKFAVGYKMANAGTTTDASSVFTDIDAHWAKDDIAFVIQRGLFGGTEKDKFSPDMPMTRGMFVTVLGRLAKADVSSYTQSHFKDVKAGSYYLPYIEWASKNNIVSGMSLDSFAPDKAITREQMAVIMANYAKMTGFELPQLQSEINFEDASEISDYAKASVKQMQRAGIISGKQASQFDSKGTATRAEVSAVLKRYIELIEKK